MPAISVFSSPFMLGFEDMERMFDRLSKVGGEGYPPYNIERFKSGDNSLQDILRITLAVAGFALENLDITLEHDQLKITGEKPQNTALESEFLHRGIAARQFQRIFMLAPGIEIIRADLRNGLLSVDLVRPEPASQIRKIEITSHD